MVANDTRVFDLLELAPVARNGWVLLGEVGSYVRVSRWVCSAISVILVNVYLHRLQEHLHYEILIDVDSDRFDDVRFLASAGIQLSLSGSTGETIAVTALQPVSHADADGSGATSDWIVHVKQLTFGSDKATMVFA